MTILLLGYSDTMLTPFIQLGSGMLGLCLGRRGYWTGVLGALRPRECVWGSLREVRLCAWLGKGPFTLRFPLLFHFISKGTKGLGRNKGGVQQHGQFDHLIHSNTSQGFGSHPPSNHISKGCLLYTSDAADE